MAFDYKKEYKEFYMPPQKPVMVEIPKMNYLAVRGTGNPNEEGSEYKTAINLLYGIAFTIKMSHKGTYKMDGYFEYVVPPLEGLWWQTGSDGIDYAHKEAFNWISMIRLPDFVSRSDFDWAVEEATKKKKLSFSKVEFFTLEEGLCVQCMHIGSYDNEPATIKSMEEFAIAKGYEIDITAERLHHEIYLSDPRKTDINKLKTVVRHPIKKESKRLLRQRLRERVEALPPEYCMEADRAIITRLMDTEAYQRATVLFCYVGRKHEINTMPLILDALNCGKQVGVPRCAGKGIMEVCRIEKPEDLEEGFYGLLEPKANCPVISPEVLELVIVPCLSATKEGGRLGYGGGYYDRYLPKVNCPKILLCREKLLSENLPREAHDVIADGIITEDTIIFH